MSRRGNFEIFNKVINKNVTYYSDPQFNDMLGQADTLVLQAIVDGTPGTETVTVQYQTSNDGAPIDALWKDVSGFACSVAPGSATDVPKSDMDRNAAGDAMGALGRVKVTCATNTSGVAVRVIACIRVDV
jgi:hypothetical protein